MGQKLPLFSILVYYIITFLLCFVNHFQVEKHSFKFAIYISDEKHPLSVALVGVIKKIALLTECMNTKYLMIKISERSFTQHFDDSMSSFSSEKRIKFDNLIYTPCTVQGDKT